MVRRKKADAEETRERILDAAERCFCDSGVARTTLEMIAKRAGCTRGAIYWHFTEKHDLLKQVIERVPLTFFTELETINGKAKHPVAAMRRSLFKVLNDVQNDRHLRNVIELVVFRGEYQEDIYGQRLFGSAGANALISRLHDIFTCAQARGEIDASLRAESLACLVYAAFSGVLMSCVLYASNSTLTRESALALDILFSSIIAAGDKEACHEPRKHYL